MRRTAALGSHLHNPLVLACRSQHGLAFDDIHTDRLLDVNVGTRFHRLDHRQRMPMIRGRDQYDVEIFLGEHLAIIPVGPRPIARLLTFLHHIRSLGDHLAIDVTERHHFHRRDLQQSKQIRFAIPTGTDQTNSLGGCVLQCSHGISIRCEKGTACRKARP